MTPEAGMIFAAGFGTRMGALTRDVPKPMLPLGGRPMVDQTIDLLREAGVGKIVANTHYLADEIGPHLKRRGVAICHEEVILDTGGGLRAALPVLECDPVVTMNPDALWQGPNPVRALAEEWRDGMQALLLVVPAPEGETGDFSLESGEIRRKGPYRYTGAQILRTGRLHEIEGPVFSLNLYWDLLLSSGPVHGLLYAGQWRDIGTAEGLSEANRRLGA